ncbi:MAG: hypothetical protein ACKPEQ_13935, partial [Dolichospermum sp.]
YPKLKTLSSPPAEITETREIIDKILNNHENEPPFIEKVLFLPKSHTNNLYPDNKISKLFNQSCNSSS